jgi:hypothetical protein
MGWAVTLLSFCEVTKEDARAATKRAKRLAEKNREGKRDGNSLGFPEGEGDVAKAEQHWETCFKKVWSMHSTWASTVLVDAITYAREHEPRSLDPEEELSTDISRTFFSTLWEPLQGRGWKMEDTESGKIFQYENHKVSQTKPMRIP